jgi:hypothetical protein
MKFEQHNPEWKNIFEEEAELIRSVLDIADLVSKEEYLQVYTPALSKIGYIYYPEDSSIERLFFRKGEPVKFHFSLAQEGKTTYWERSFSWSGLF